MVRRIPIDVRLCRMCQQQPSGRPLVCVSIPLLLPSMSAEELIDVLEQAVLE